jgi:hypothetical protein
MAAAGGTDVAGRDVFGDPVVRAAVDAWRVLTAAERADVEERHEARLRPGASGLECRACGYVYERRRGRKAAGDLVCPSVMYARTGSVRAALAVVPTVPQERRYPCRRCGVQVPAVGPEPLCGSCEGQGDLFGGEA